MSDNDGVLTIHIDGAARGNPGPAAYAYVIARSGAAADEHAECIGQLTNNVAEYTALVHALERAAEIGGQRLTIHSDSELLVKQMNGEYRVKHPDLKPLYEDAVELRKQFTNVVIRHVRREQNKRADELCNLALDGKLRGGAIPPAAASAAKAEKPKAATGVSLEERVRGEALACLDAAAAAWKRGDPLPTTLVWEQLWDLLGEAGVLKKGR